MKDELDYRSRNLFSGVYIDVVFISALIDISLESRK